jgi:hypothetical protein
MAKFNEEMVKAGVMLHGNGLQPSSKGARVRFSGDKRSVIDGLKTPCTLNASVQTCQPFSSKRMMSKHRE